MGKDDFKAFCKNCYRDFPPMTTVNRLLKNDVIWDLIKRKFGFSNERKFPDFDDKLLYGVLSELIHNPDIENIIVSNLASNNYKDFFLELGVYFNRKCKEFNEMSTESVPDGKKI
jgi:hypothetical protein